MSITVNDEKLTAFVAKVFETFGISKENAHICADNLVLADLRGIPSHGVARLKRYVDGMKTGIILPLSKPEIVHESPSTATTLIRSPSFMGASLYAFQSSPCNRT